MTFFASAISGSNPDVAEKLHRQNLITFIGIFYE
jgi:hypothetical protein